MEMCKTQGKLMIFDSEYCFANISATKGRIFMKLNLSSYDSTPTKKFGDYPCTHTRTRGKNVHAQISLHVCEVSYGKTHRIRYAIGDRVKWLKQDSLLEAITQVT